MLEYLSPQTFVDLFAAVSAHANHLVISERRMLAQASRVAKNSRLARTILAFFGVLTEKVILIPDHLSSQWRLSCTASVTLLGKAR